MRKIDPKTYEPTGYRVLVRDLKVDEVSKGGIILPESTQSADQHAQQFGHIVAKAPLAFTYDGKAGPIADPAAPDVGDLVNYSKYSGGEYQTDDADNVYRIINDQDIKGVVERAAT